MITAEYANYLLSLPKYIVENNSLLESKQLLIYNPLKLRFTLRSENDNTSQFLIAIKESPKKELKISLHVQENSSYLELLRIDYFSRHKNPIEILDTVPMHFRPFAGKMLNTHHIHYVVDGYKPLAWAIPLENDDFTLKTIQNLNDVKEAVNAFFQRINCQTIITFTIQNPLL